MFDCLSVFITICHYVSLKSLKNEYSSLSRSADENFVKCNKKKFELDEGRVFLVGLVEYSNNGRFSELLIFGVLLGIIMQKRINKDWRCV